MELIPDMTMQGFCAAAVSAQAMPCIIVIEALDMTVMIAELQRRAECSELSDGGVENTRYTDVYLALILVLKWVCASAGSQSGTCNHLHR